MKRAIALIAILGFMGCSMPSTVVKTTDTRPGIAIEGAPKGSLLLIDGMQAGEAEKFDGAPNVLRVEPGTHRIVIKGTGGETLFDQKVFVESELKTIKVH